MKSFILMFFLWGMSVHAEVSEQDFHDVMVDFHRGAHSWVKENYNKELIITSDWSKEWSETSSGAGFYFPKFQWGLYITGWLARHEAIDIDSLYFVLCHELGHHVYGGAKERHADYFAAKTCLPWFWKQKEYKERLFSSFERVQLFRKWMWEKASFSEARISWLYSCRKSVLTQGFLNLPFVDCPKE